MAAEKVDYLRDIKPLLRTKCYSCHGVLKQESGLRLETLALMQKGGESGRVIVPGKPGDSPLLERISAKGDERMPPPADGAALKSAEIALLTRWIAEGAKAPAEATPESPRAHWAFKVVPQPNAGNSIDSLLAHRHRRLGIVPQPLADRSLRIRRLYLDLIGLPPTREQLNDKRPWSKIVDELLSSPLHAERWGRHWMDVWRYTDWYGLGAQLRNSQKHIWRWRDWIVESLHEDKPYDRMILEMLAGDELAPDDPQVIRATGFLARNYYLFNRTTWLDSTIEHTGKAFIGLTLNCAKCHDHKYDPITHVDYYRFRAIFEPHQVRLDPVPGTTDLEKDGLPRVFDDHLDAKTYLHVRGNPKNLDKQNPLSPGIPAILSDIGYQPKSISLPPTAHAPGLRKYVRQDRLKPVQTELTQLKIAEAAAQKAAQVAARKKVELAKRQPSKKKSLPKKKAPKPVAKKPAAPTFRFRDDFDAPRPTDWKIVGSGWKYRDGALHQTRSNRDQEFLVLQRKLPRNFVLKTRYTTTGGDTYKSVTYRFDQSDDGKYAHFVYTSAVTGGNKVQIALTRNGKHQYPAAAALGTKIPVGKPIDLQFAVRDTLVNVWLNGKFVLAYALPDRKPGRLSLSGFDATVAFDWIEITSLPSNLKLTPVAGGVAKVNPKDPQRLYEIAVARRQATAAKLASLQATFAADTARLSGAAPADKITALSREAAVKQAEVSKAEAKRDLLMANGNAKKTQAASTRMTNADKQLAAAKSSKTPQYATLRVSRKALETPAHKEGDYPAHYSSTSSGRRLALAKWITSRQNPLTARVAVNHVWMRHFGQPLVESVFDFGLRTKRPKQAAVLDHLAGEFMESGWSFRHLHRLIVNSNAYQRQTTTVDANPQSLQKDPNNTEYWRSNTRRMEAQVVRDSLLYIGGQLDLTRGGPPLDPSNKVRRRSIYFKHSRDHQDRFLNMFDDADHLQCYRRAESIIPQQALALSNSKLAIEMSTKIAAAISKQNTKADQQQYIDLAFELIIGRRPDAAERQACVEFCGAIAKTPAAQKAADKQQRVRAMLVHALINHNDFVSIR